MIDIQNIYFSYNTDTPPVLNGLSLTIREDEWLTIIGANGSGKSTLARCINGLLIPSSGVVLVDGLKTSDEDELVKIREKVAFVFQNPDNQFVATSVEDDIAFGPENLGLPREEITRRVEMALAAVNLTDKRDKAPHLLSGGEKQRVALAGALAMASRYLVVDEPTSMLDPLMREQVLETLSMLHSEYHMGVVYVTNVMEEALLADRVVVLDAGCIVKSASPAVVFSEYEWLRQKGLDVPQISHLSSMLADDGYEYLRGALSEDDLMERLCK